MRLFTVPCSQTDSTVGEGAPARCAPTANGVAAKTAHVAMTVGQNRILFSLERMRSRFPDRNSPTSARALPDGRVRKAAHRVCNRGSSMGVPFSRESFLAAFRSYNDAIGIVPLLLMALAVGIVVVARSSMTWRHRAIAAGLAGPWLWAGVVYHWGFFARINPAARIFGAAFVVQAALLLWRGTLRGSLRFDPRQGRIAAVGWALVTYALVAYPLIGWFAGHGYPDGPSFGAPCPMTIFFIGTLFWIEGRIPIALAVIPALWGLVAMSAAVQFGIVEDFGLGVGVAALLVELVRRRMHRALIAPAAVERHA